jgi:hypothetical protein
MAIRNAPLVGHPVKLGKRYRSMRTPNIGDTYTIYGTIGTIIEVHAFGTIDIELPDGRCYRVTGLAFL